MKRITNPSFKKEKTIEILYLIQVIPNPKPAQERIRSQLSLTAHCDYKVNSEKRLDKWSGGVVVVRGVIWAPAQTELKQVSAVLSTVKLSLTQLSLYYSFSQVKVSRHQRMHQWRLFVIAAGLVTVRRSLRPQQQATRWQTDWLITNGRLIAANAAASNLLWVHNEFPAVEISQSAFFSRAWDFLASFIAWDRKRIKVAIESTRRLEMGNPAIRISRMLKPEHFFLNWWPAFFSSQNIFQKRTNLISWMNFSNIGAMLIKREQRFLTLYIAEYIKYTWAIVFAFYHVLTFLIL